MERVPLLADSPGQGRPAMEGGQGEGLEGQGRQSLPGPLAGVEEGPGGEVDAVGGRRAGEAVCHLTQVRRGAITQGEEATTLEKKEEVRKVEEVREMEQVREV